MVQSKYADEFKEEAVRQVIDRGYSVTDVAKRLDVSAQSLYKWVKASPSKDDSQEREVRKENLRLKSALRRTEEERDILKKAAVSSIGQRNTSLYNLFWCFKFQCFSGSFI